MSLPGRAEAPPVASDYVWQLPPGFPQPLIPADNPMTQAKVTLGEALFDEPRLSVTGALSCGGCHDPERYFIDGVDKSRGALGDKLAFNTPTLINSAYSSSLSWIDKGLLTLEEQHRGPLGNTKPVELGMGPQQLRQLDADATLGALRASAFPTSTHFTQENVAAALASYVRTLIAGDRPFDRYLFLGERDALSQEALRGLALFTSSRLNCAACHRGFLLSGPTRSVRASFPPSFYQTGVSGSELAFRAPSLRFIAQTAPYMHDGSLSSLSAVIAFYESIDPKHSDAPAIGAEAAERLPSFTLTVAERAELLAFLQSL